MSNLLSRFFFKTWHFNLFNNYNFNDTISHISDKFHLFSFFQNSLSDSFISIINPFQESAFGNIQLSLFLFSITLIFKNHFLSSIWIPSLWFFTCRLPKTSKVIMRNHTVLTTFILLGLTEDPQLQVLILVFLFLTYLLSISGNLTIIILTFLNSPLKTPMHFFLETS